MLLFSTIFLLATDTVCKLMMVMLNVICIIYHARFVICSDSIFLDTYL